MAIAIHGGLSPAITGDKITIDWTSEPDANGAYLTALWAYLYPVGTTDFNFPNTNPVAEKDVNYAVTGLQELQYVTNRDETLPLEFQAGASNCQADAGPYSFTAYVSHELVLALHAHTTERTTRPCSPSRSTIQMARRSRECLSSRPTSS